MTEQTDSSWSSMRVSGLSGTKLGIHRLRWAIAQLAECGITVPRSGRHYAALRLLERLERNSETLSINDQAQLELAAEADRSAFELMMIVWAAWQTQRPGGPFTMARITEILDGSALPDEKLTRARDKQFELFVGALLALSRLTVFDGEPDLRVDIGSEIVGIAAKRIRSANPNTIRARVAAATEQLRRVRDPDASTLRSDLIDLVGGRGFIALSVDRHYERAIGRVTEIDHRQQFEGALRELGAAIERSADDPAVMGILVFAVLANWSPGEDGPKLDMHTPLHWIAMGDAVEVQQGKLLFDGVLARLRPQLQAAMGSCPREVLKGPRPLY